MRRRKSAAGPHPAECRSRGGAREPGRQMRKSPGMTQAERAAAKAAIDGAVVAIGRMRGQEKAGGAVDHLVRKAAGEAGDFLVKLGAAGWIEFAERQRNRSGPSPKGEASRGTPPPDEPAGCPGGKPKAGAPEPAKKTAPASAGTAPAMPGPSEPLARETLGVLIDGLIQTHSELVLDLRVNSPALTRFRRLIQTLTRIEQRL